MGLRLSRLIIMFFGAIFLLNLSAGHELTYYIEGDRNVDSEHTFYFFNNSSVDDIELVLFSPSEQEQSFSLSETGEKFQKDLDSSNFSSEGVYSYYFNIDEEKAPKTGHRTISIGLENETLEENALELLGSRPSEDPYCSEEGDFQCEYEHFQGHMMSKYALAYSISGKDSHKEKALNFSTSEYGSQAHRRLECRHEIDDFDCDSDAGGEFNVSGAERQGSLIDGLWSVYQVTGDETTKDLAENYTLGSAYNCDVWEGDFDCETGNNQGSMMSGYWKAYEVTGNNTYKQIAQNLSKTSKIHPSIVEGFSEAYLLTQSPEYRKNLTKSYRESLEVCESNCGEKEHLELSRAGFLGYRATEDYNFYRTAVLEGEKSETSCYSDDNNSCSNPKTQSVAAETAFNRHSSERSDDKKFHNSQILSHPSTNDSLKVTTDLSGLIDSPEAVLKNINGSEIERCSLDPLENSCEFEHNFLQQNLYYYSLESDDLTYPSSGKLPVPYSEINNNLWNDVSDLIYTGSESTCNPLEGDTRCVVSDERYQANYIIGLSNAYIGRYREEYLSTIEELSLPPYHYDPEEGYRAECIPDEDFLEDEDVTPYSCDSSDGVFAGERQGSLIESLFTAYSITGNNSIRELGEYYASTSVVDDQDCQVWDNDFECRSSESQGSMMSGYWKAYEVTGNNTYKQIAQNLTESGTDMNTSYEISSGFWNSYTHSGNTEWKETADNKTSNYIDDVDCINDCEDLEYSNQGGLILQAYETTGNSTYRNRLDELVDQRNSYDCLETGSCETPLLQGSMLSYLGQSSLLISIDLDDEVDAFDSIELSENEIDIGESTNATCEVENNSNDITLQNLGLQISVPDLFEVREESYFFGDLGPGENLTESEEFVSNATGETEFNCEWTAAEYQTDSSETVSVLDDTPDSDNGDSGSDESPGAPPEEIEDEEDDIDDDVVYSDLDILNVTEDHMPNKSLYSFRSVEECITATRSFEENNTFLEVENECDSDTGLIIKDYNAEENQELLETYYSSFSSDRFEYSFHSNESEWYSPEAAFFDKKPLELETPPEQEKITDEHYFSTLSLNRESNCDIYHNETLIGTDSGEEIQKNISLHKGLNNITYACNGETATKMIEYDFEKETLPYHLILMFLTATSGSALLIVYRQQILSASLSLAFKANFKVFKWHIDNQKPDKALKDYRRLQKVHNWMNKNNHVAASNLELLKDMKIYMMADLATDSDIDTSTLSHNSR